VPAPTSVETPKGEIHEDEGWFSFDRARKRMVLRQFHVEGFANQYVQNADSAALRLVFTTESIENIPAGWRARETYVVPGPDEFEDVFEFAEPGKEFELYSRARLKRVRRRNSRNRRPLRPNAWSGVLTRDVTQSTPARPKHLSAYDGWCVAVIWKGYFYPVVPGKIGDFTKGAGHRRGTPSSASFAAMASP
jgi:hypothetical protein